MFRYALFRNFYWGQREKVGCHLGKYLARLRAAESALLRRLRCIGLAYNVYVKIIVLVVESYWVSYADFNYKSPQGLSIYEINPINNRVFLYHFIF